MLPESQCKPADLRKAKLWAMLSGNILQSLILQGLNCSLLFFPQLIVCRKRSQESACKGLREKPRSCPEQRYRLPLPLRANSLWKAPSRLGEHCGIPLYCRLQRFRACSSFAPRFRPLLFRLEPKLPEACQYCIS